MNLSRCENGHFFDKEKYASCPHCAGGVPSDDSLTTVFTEDMNAGGTVSETLPLDEATLPIANTPANQPTMPAENMGGIAIADTPTVPLTPDVSFDNQNFAPETSDDDHTVAFYDDVFSSVAPANNNATPQTPVANQVSSPCVGWLIAIGGAHIGQDFRLKVGKNFVGRDAQMDIALTGDKSVSRNRHAIIVYEPKQHLYLVQPGEASGLVYRNNEVVLNPVKLEAYDMITVGEVNLLFMPLCGERFNWSELLEEMNKEKEGK